MDIIRQNTVFSIINAAITGRQVVQLGIKNTWRTVEPYVVGLHRVTHEITLYGYCRDTVQGNTAANRWEIFRLNEIDSAELTYYSFLPHADYNGRAEAVEPVFRRLKPLFSEMTPGHWSVRVTHNSAQKFRLSK